MNLISLIDLTKHFSITKGLIFRDILGEVKAVDGINLDIAQGETLGVVGETGCGKTTLAKLILGLEKPTEGHILFEGKDITRFKAAKLKDFRRKAQIVFQDPFSSLNPRMKVRNIITEPLIVHNGISRSKLGHEAEKLLKKVGLSAKQGERYPHEFSGGQRQRIGIARALALKPKLILLDEPVSALDVSIQAQILNLITDLQKEFKLTYIFISHDLSVIKHVATRIAVMYLGKIVELAQAHDLFSNPQHPYTEALLSACPFPDPKIKQRRRLILAGDVPSALNPPSGCHFHPRCRYAKDSCKIFEPKWATSDPKTNHKALCSILPFKEQVSASAIQTKGTKH
ncbi:ABC transporter ATP-binding protein [Elusimicrobiota bacterium]